MRDTRTGGQPSTRACCSMHLCISVHFYTTETPRSCERQTFEGKLVDSSHGALNEVTMAEHWSTGAQVVLYATDYIEFT